MHRFMVGGEKGSWTTSLPNFTWKNGVCLCVDVQVGMYFCSSPVTALSVGYDCNDRCQLVVGTQLGEVLWLRWIVP